MENAQNAEVAIPADSDESFVGDRTTTNQGRIPMGLAPGEPPKSPSRFLSIDLWKAVSIYGVVWIHCSFLVPHSPAHLDLISPLFQFCVPVFLMVWAYLAERSMQKTGSTSGKSVQRMAKLAIPFMFWSLAYWLLHADFQSPISSQISKYWSGYGWPGQYFFVVLFQFLGIFSVLRALTARWSPLAIATGGVVAFSLFSVIPFETDLVLKIGDRPFLYWLPYVLFGTSLARHGGFPIRVRLIPVALLILAIPIEAKWIHGPLSRIGPYLHLSVFLSSLGIGVWSVQNSGKDLRLAPWMTRIIQSLSRNSLAIFCINPLFLTLSQRWLHLPHPVSFPGAFLVVPFLATSLVVAASLLVGKFLERIGLGILCRN